MYIYNNVDALYTKEANNKNDVALIDVLSLLI